MWWQVTLYSLDQELASQLVPEPHRKVASTGIDTTDWKTYRNEKYGFEFQYKGKQVALEHVGSSYLSESTIVTANTTDIVIANTTELRTKAKEYIQRYLPPNGLQTFRDEDSESGLYVECNRETIPNGLITFDAVYCRGEGGPVFYARVVGQAFDLFINGDDPIEARSILETLKFFDLKPQVDTSTWKTYQNEKYGFEVKYPSDWGVSDHSSGLLSLKKTEGRLSGIQSFFAINIQKNYEINLKTSAVAVMEQISIGGRLGYKYFYQEGAGTSEVILIQLGQDALQLSLDYFESSGGNFNDKKITIQGVIDPILSTFKFFEPIAK